jgi:hypothetical protein
MACNGNEANQYCSGAQHANLIVSGLSRNNSGMGEDGMPNKIIASVELIEADIIHPWS